MVIVCHGFTGTKEGNGNARLMAEELGAQGFSTLLFDFAGNGESPGLFEEITLSGQINDLGSVIDYVEDLGFSPIITQGRSFGGSTVICHGANDLRVAGVCTWAAPADLMEVFLNFTDGDLPASDEELVMLSDVDGVVHLKRSFFWDLEKYDVAASASMISPRPLLVIQGLADQVVPPANGQKIFEGAGEPRQLVYLDKADHQFSNMNKEVWKVFIEWLENSFK